MSILYLESFDDELYAKRSSAWAGTTPNSSYGAHGKGTLLGDSVGKYYRIPYVGSGARIIIGFNYYFSAGPTGVQSIASLHTTGYSKLAYDAANDRIGLMVKPNTVASYYYWGAIGDVPGGEWHYVEWNILPSTGSAGTVSMYVDGALSGSSYSSIDYYTLPNQIQLGDTASDGVDQWWCDDVYVCDDTGGVNDDVLGPIEVVPLLPDGNGTYSNLTGQDADKTDNYLNVDEATPDDGTTYNGSATEGDEDTYTMDDLTGTPDVVGAVLSMNAAKTDSGAKFMRAIARTADSLVDYTTTPTITSSSEYSTYTPGKAWRAVADYWVSATVGSTEWWKADFGSAKDFGKVDFELYFGASTYPTVVDLQYSDNDSDWYNAADQLTGVTATTYEVSVDSDVTSHRYWRLLFSSFSGSSGMEADNIYFYEVSATAGDTVGTSKALGVSYGLHEEVFDLNPGTFKLWTYTTLNGTEFGAEVRNS